MEGKCSFLTNSQYTNSDIPSLSMIELQGDLESMVEGKLNGLQLGALKYNQLENNYTLQIENHAIIGEKIKLDKPLMITKKIRREEGTELSIRGIVTEKILFKNRPSHISNPTKKLKFTD